MTDSTRHILCMSGGKDSTALALYMRDRIPQMEYVFCDTDKELTETYEYLSRVAEGALPNSFSKECFSGMVRGRSRKFSLWSRGIELPERIENPGFKAGILCHPLAMLYQQHRDTSSNRTDTVMIL